MEEKIQKCELGNQTLNGVSGDRQSTETSDDNDYFTVGVYDKNIVASNLRQSVQPQNWSCLNLKHFSQSLLGNTWHVLLVYLAGYYLLQVLYQLKYVESICVTMLFTAFDDVDDAQNHTQQCNTLIINWVDLWNGQERMELSCITFFLGFYVNHEAKRWWEQLTRVPSIEPISLYLAGLVWTPKKTTTDRKTSVMVFRKTILRYCLLSWAMTFHRFSNIDKHLKNEADFISKKLLTYKEYAILSSGSSVKEGWIYQWWIPLTWAINMINKSFNETLIVPKDHKDLIGTVSYTHLTLPTNREV